MNRLKRAPGRGLKPGQAASGLLESAAPSPRRPVRVAPAPAELSPDTEQTA